MLEANPEMGTITIETTRTELNGEQVYALYKQRQQIEQCFKAYDDSLGFDSSYMHGDVSMEAWLFLNTPFPDDGIRCSLPDLSQREGEECVF